MQFILLAIVVFVVAALSSPGQIFNMEWMKFQSPDQAQEKVSQQEPQEAKSIIKSGGLASVAPKKPEPVVLLDTYITLGPKEGEIIEDTNKVTFEFEAKILLNETKTRITFETKCEGFNEDWVSTYSKKREIQLPPGPKEYKFLVRAKTKDAVDPTPAIRNFKINTSPYFGKIKISSPRVQTSSHPSLITLSSQLSKEEKVNITNWRLKGNQGEIIIPQGTEKYPSSSYGLVPKGDIFIERGDKIYLLSGSNPLGGTNNGFRLNKCFGYFLNYQKFYPSFSRSCPKPKLAGISHLSQFCQEFILDLSQCKIPDYSRNLKVASSSECTSYINDYFNYRGCFNYHSQDEDFLKNYWYIYVGSNIVSQFHDTLYLYDKDGLLVDKYLY